MSVQPPGNGYKERRRHLRQPTLQAARIYIDDGEAIAAEIRDYCPSGLYISFPGGVTPDAAIPVLVGTPVLIEMANAAPGGLRFEGRVARVAPNAVGVFVQAMPDAALEFLRRGHSPAGPFADSPAGANRDPRSLSAQTLKLECTNLFRMFLDAVMQEFFQSAEERLSVAGMETLSFLERSRFTHCARELALHRSRIEAQYFNLIRERIQTLKPIDDGPGKTGTESSRAARKLALVDEDEFEDWLNLSAVIKQIEADVVEQLDTFELRYGRLVGIPINRKNDPFGPEGIARAFQQAIQILDFSNTVRTVLYKTLGQAISSRSASLYEQLNQALISLQPDEPVRESRDERKPESAPMEAFDGQTGGVAPADTLDGALADALANLFRQDGAGMEAASGSTEYSLDRILSSLGHSQRAASARKMSAPAAARQPDPGASPYQTVVPHEALQMARQLRQAVRQLGRHKDDAPAGQSGHPEQADARPAASLQELKRVLDRLPLSGQDAAGSMQPGSLSDQVDAHVATDNGELRRLTREHRQLLDSAAEFFVRTRANIVPSSDIETLLRRMERPLLKLALQDASFPDMPDHPARQVINLIEQFTVAADDDGKLFDAKLQRFLFLLVDRICNRVDEDPGIFVTVRDHLEKVLIPILHIRRTRIARMQEASEGRERIRSARLNVNTALEQRLAGRDVPGMVLRLLDAGWRQYLVLLEMRQGSMNEAWQAALTVLDRLFEWLSADQGAVPRGAGARAVLLGEIERGLKTVNVDIKLLAVFMDELNACLATEPGLEATAFATVRVPAGRLAKQVGNRRGVSDTVHQRLADRLRVGDWWEMDVSGKPVPMQLIWTSEPPLTSVFANRSATSKLEFSLPGLSQHIHGGLAKPGKDMDMPVVERSEHALFDETYQELMHQVLHDETTGLLSRKGFMQRLGLLGMPEDNSRMHVVGIVEFDQFRMIYNTCGVDAVETLARSLAHEAQASMGTDAVLASFRDDTLAVLLPNCSRATGSEAIDQLLGPMRDYRFQHETHSYSIGFNLGVAEFSPAQISAADVIRRADSACITAKAQGRNRMQIYEQASPQLQTQESLMDWAGRIDAFLTGKGLHLRCQQVMPLEPNAPYMPHYEVLLGIEDENGIEINPMHFIPAVERLQRAHEIDIWVMRKVFSWITDNRKKFDTLGGFAINLSATSLSSPEVILYLKEALQASDFPTHKITFEITETAAIGSYGAAQDFIREIRRFGCKFALDDFGSGFTSYAHLKNLRTDSLKIDGSFVKDMLNNPGDHAMVKSMNDIAHSLGLKTIAEYVESPMILLALREIGVDYAQGYAVHKPCLIDDLPYEQ